MAGLADDAARAAWESQSLRPLVTALEQIEAVAEIAVRTQLISLIEVELRIEQPRFSLPVARSTVRRIDVVALVGACLQVRGGIRALRAAAAVLFGDSGLVGSLLAECDGALELEPSLLTEEKRTELLEVLHGISLSAHADVPSLVARATSPISVQTTVSTFVGAVAQLERRGTAVPLLRFLELIANHSYQDRAVTSLRSWIDEHLNLVEPHRRAEVTGLRAADTRATGSTGIRTCLLVQVEPVEDDTFSVLAWLGQTDSPFGANCGPEDVVTLDELQQWLCAFIECYAHGALEPGRRPLIEFALPSSHFNMPVDTWHLADGERLGVRYQVIVRPSTRPTSAMSMLSDRWKMLVDAAGAQDPAPASARWLHSTDSVSVDDPLSPSWTWLAVTCPQMGRHAAVVDAVLATGAPVVAWLRGEQDGPARRAVLEGLSRGRLITQFPDAVRKFRENGWHDDSDHRDLVLLWDDPTRPPPQSYLVNAPERRT